MGPNPRPSPSLQSFYNIYSEHLVKAHLVSCVRVWQGWGPPCWHAAQARKGKQCASHPSSFSTSPALVLLTCIMWSNVCTDISSQKCNYVATWKKHFWRGHIRGRKDLGVTLICIHPYTKYVTLEPSLNLWAQAPHLWMGARGIYTTLLLWRFCELQGEQVAWLRRTSTDGSCY